MNAPVVGQVHTPSHDLLVRNACVALGNAAFHDNTLYEELFNQGAIPHLVRVLEVRGCGGGCRAQSALLRSTPGKTAVTCDCHPSQCVLTHCGLLSIVARVMHAVNGHSCNHTKTNCRCSRTTRRLGPMPLPRLETLPENPTRCVRRWSLEGQRRPALGPECVHVHTYFLLQGWLGVCVPAGCLVLSVSWCQANGRAIGGNTITASTTTLDSRRRARTGECTRKDGG